MLRIVLLLAAFLIGCTGEDESAPAKINPGTYELRATLSFEGERSDFRYQRVLSPSGGLREAIFVDDRVYCETRGAWSLDGDKLLMDEVEVRCAEDSTGAMSSWSYQGGLEQAIRSITESSFELYASRPASSEFVKAGLKNGWEKYTRTGD